LVSCIPQNEMVVFAGDMNGHVGSSNAGYEGTHGGFGYSSRNTDGSRILEFADGLNLFGIGCFARQIMVCEAFIMPPLIGGLSNSAIHSSVCLSVSCW